MKKLLFFLLLSFCSFSFLFAQQRKIDSLENLLKTDKEDTNKVNHLNQLGGRYGEVQLLEKDSVYSFGAVELAKKLNYQTGLAKAYNNLGIINLLHSNYSTALDYFSKALQTYGDKGSILDKESVTGNMGLVYADVGNSPKAIECYLDALALAEKINDKGAMSADHSNISGIYFQQGDYSKSLENMQMALKLDKESNNKSGEGDDLSSIGTIYAAQNKLQEAMESYTKSLELSEEVTDTMAISTTLGGIGGIYNARKEYPKALEYYFKSLSMHEKMGDKMGMANSFCPIGQIYLSEKKYQDAESSILKALQIANDIQFYDVIIQGNDILSEIYDSTGQWQKAYDATKKYVAAKDSMFNKDKSKEIGKLEAKFDYDKDLAVKQANYDNQLLLDQAEKRKQRIVIISILGGLLLVIVFAVFVFRSLQTTRKQKQIIEIKNKETEEQKKVIEEKNKDILDSITYSKRLQDAILPPLSLIEKYLPQSFLLYKPKDIIAGDFYWMERVGDTLLIAAADCTGHGVPGAMVSVVCSNALNRGVREFHLTEPGKILDKARELLLETFEKSESNIQDGMDISLCCIKAYPQPFPEGREKNPVSPVLPTGEGLGGAAIQWSGAYNSLWYIQNGEIHEISGDKQPIGKHDKQVPFNTHNLKLQPGDALYLFTDGYADQFGGPKGKKFKYKQLEELLLANAAKPMEEQKLKLEETLEAWKGSLEQVDDVLIMGIRV